MLFTSPLRHALRLPRLPSLCALCHGWGDARICADCVARFAAPRQRCLRCAIDLPAAAPLCGACLLNPPPQAHTLAAFDYTPPWDGVIARFKFHSALDLGEALAARLLHALREARVTPPDLLLPVPLSAARLRERGYNQAWEIARRIAKALPCPADPHLLLRTVDTAHQLALPVPARAANVRGAFAVEPLRARELRGKQVALLDDVLTSGATASEISRSLLQAGAESVQVWVLARTPRPGA